MKRRVNPRDLPFAAEGGTYHVVNGQLQAEADIAPAPADVEEAASTEEAHAAAPSARPQGGRTSRTKE